MSATVGHVTNHAWGMAGPAPDGAPTQDNEDFLHMLLRRYRLVLACVGLSLGLAVAAIVFLPDRYVARAVMRVDVDDIDTSSLQANALSTRELEMRRDHQIETQLQLLSSRPMMRKVVRSLALFDDREFNPAAGTLAPGVVRVNGKLPPVSPLVIEAVTDNLITAVKIAQDGQTSFINIDVTSGSPFKAARIANKIAATYVADQVLEKRASNERAIGTLRVQVADLRTQLIANENQAAGYKRQHRLDGTSGDDNAAMQISRLAGDLASARASRAENDARVGRNLTDPDAMSSPLLSNLRQERTEARRKLAELTTTFGRGYPEVPKTEAQLTEIDRSIAVEADRVRNEVERDRTAHSAREAQLSSELSSVQSRALGDLITAVPLADLDRTGSATRNVYVSLLSRLDTLVRENDLIRPDATIAFTALPPTTPYSPKPARILVAAAAGSVLLALLVVLIVEQLDTRIRTAAQVRRLVDLPTFGMVPELARKRREQLRRADAIDRPYSAFTEEIRSVFVKIRRLLPASGGGVVLLTSPEAGDGKTSLSLALAMAAVATNRAAVVIDFDLRRPDLTQRIGAAPVQGDLLDYLRGEVSLEHIIRPCEGMPTLKVIGPDKPADDPGALLSSDRLPSLLDQLRSRFDLVILNTPPILAASDAAILSSLADLTLLVVSWGRTSRATLRTAANDVGEDVTGVIFNHVKSPANSRATYASYAFQRDSGALRHFRIARRRAHAMGGVGELAAHPSHGVDG